MPQRAPASQKVPLTPQPLVPPQPSAQVQPKQFVVPKPGEIITSSITQNSYTIGDKIGEGNFGFVFDCKDVWENELAVKVFKPKGRTYDQVKAAAQSELMKLVELRNPFITFVYDAFEFRDTFYIVTDRCHCSVSDLFSFPNFQGQGWIMPIARCLLQATHFLHINNYAHQDIHPGNVLAAVVKDELVHTNPGVVKFKLSDLGVAKMFGQLSATNTRGQWMLPPEVLNSAEFGVIDHRIDIYHLGLLFLQLAYSKQLRFEKEDILNGKPREMALVLPPPFNFALEKALRRHVNKRTATAMELWRDLHTPLLPKNTAS